ncbi:hypothetical protein JC2156_01650 [Weissella koreensis KCTC 3621]|nr:hypothetical protein JC2156_03010 [Weissella koreensis KCTC 3621]EJF34283.1 hypothetical protein JC2156_01650 [Weissella koreensis KCTC 3621]
MTPVPIHNAISIPINKNKNNGAKPVLIPANMLSCISDHETFLKRNIIVSKTKLTINGIKAGRLRPIIPVLKIKISPRTILNANLKLTLFVFSFIFIFLFNKKVPTTLKNVVGTKHHFPRYHPKLPVQKRTSHFTKLNC